MPATLDEVRWLLRCEVCPRCQFRVGAAASGCSPLPCEKECLAFSELGEIVEAVRLGLISTADAYAPEAREQLARMCALRAGGERSVMGRSCALGLYSGLVLRTIEQALGVQHEDAETPADTLDLNTSHCFIPG